MAHHASLSCGRHITQTSFRPDYIALKAAILLYSIDCVDSSRNARPGTNSIRAFVCHCASLTYRRIYENIMNFLPAALWASDNDDWHSRHALDYICQ